MDRINERVDSKFRFVLLAAKRAEQLLQGARPKVKTDHTKNARVAMAEVLEGQIAWNYGPAPEPEGRETETSTEELAEEDGVN